MVVAGFVLAIIGYTAVYSGVSNIMHQGKGLSFLQALLGKDPSTGKVLTASQSQGTASMMSGISGLLNQASGSTPAAGGAPAGNPNAPAGTQPGQQGSLPPGSISA